MWGVRSGRGWRHDFGEYWKWLDLFMISRKRTCCYLAGSTRVGGGIICLVPGVEGLVFLMEFLSTGSVSSFMWNYDQLRRISSAGDNMQHT